MLPRLLCLRLALLIGLLGGLLHPAWAAGPVPVPPAGALTAAQVDQVLGVLKDDRRRAALISELETISRAMPAVAASPAAGGPAPPAGAAQAASAPAPQAAAPAAIPLPLAHDGLAWRLLVNASVGLQAAGQELVTTVEAVNNLPDLVLWLNVQTSDPHARARVVGALWRLCAVFVGALAAEWVAVRLLRPLRATLARWAPVTADPGEGQHAGVNGLASAEAGESEQLAGHRRLTGALWLVRRLPFAVGRLLLDLLPVAVFVAAGALLLGSTLLGASGTTQFAARAALDAYAFCRMVLCVVRLLVAPRQPRLRLVHISDEGARFAVQLTGWVVGVGAAGNAVGQVGLMLGMYLSARQAWFKLVALIIVVMLIWGVLRCRRAVAARLRALPGETGALAALRNRFAEIWHLVAIFWLVAIWLVWAVEVQDGIGRLVEFVLSTSAVLVVARLVGILLLGGLEKLFRLGPVALGDHPGLEARVNFYYPIARRLVIGLVAGLTGVALLEVWGFAPVAWLGSSSLGGQALSALALILVTVALAVTAWEAANAGIERYLARLSHEPERSRAARLRTLLPFLRTTLLVAIVAVVVLTVLSQIGVNIAPLLAGAGVIGIAVGLGAQKLVQDVITGLFLLLENAMQVGDTVTLAGMTGTVDTLSIRTIRLRAGDGSVNIIPFSAVTTVNNASRDFAYAAVSVGVAYKEDTDRVSKVLAEIVADMQSDELFSDQILGDFSLWGVDQLGDFAVTIKGQVKTTAAGRWAVQREINRRIKRRFEALGIEIPFPVQTILLGDGTPPGAAPHADDAHAPPPRTDFASPPPQALGHTA